MTIQSASPIGTYVFDRGGLTNSPAEGIEPVDEHDVCTNCFDTIKKSARVLMQAYHF